MKTRMLIHGLWSLAFACCLLSVPSTAGAQTVKEEFPSFTHNNEPDGTLYLPAPPENFQEMKEHTDVVKSTFFKYIKKDKTLRGLVANVLIAEADFMVIYVDQETRDVNDKIVVTFSNEELQKIFEAGEEEEE